MIIIVIPFNSNYIEPALVSASLISKRLTSCMNNGVRNNFLVTLAYFVDDKAALVKSCVEQFIQANSEINCILIEHSLDEFKRYHFDNSIVKKAFIPLYFPDTSHILCLDAGFIPGTNFSKLLMCCDDICQNQEFTLACVVQGASENMPIFKEYLSHNKYVVGWALLFNVARYVRDNLGERISTNYVKLKQHLIYAEQELLTLSVHSNDILELSESYFSTFQLSINWLSEQPKDFQKIRNSSLYKCTGTFKPWHYYVLDPAKAYWLNLADPILRDCGLLDSELIDFNRRAVPIPRAQVEFQKTFNLSLKTRTQPTTP